MKLAKYAILTIGLIAGAGFLMTGSTSHANSPKGPAIDPRLKMPADVALFVNRSCGDCHTNQPHLPWYGRVPPASWLLAEDIAAAHKAVNFTQWGEKNGKSRGSAIATLSAACVDLQSGRMPLPKYLWMHPAAKPQPGDVARFCEWTHEEVARLVRSKAHTPAK